MMDDDNDDNTRETVNPFRRMKLTEEQADRFLWASRRKRDLPSLMLERALLEAYVEGESPWIDAEARQGILLSIDELRALIAMRPAQNLDELCLKCGALLRPTHAVAANADLPALASAGIHEDVLRLGLRPPFPEWLVKWLGQ